MFSVGDVLMCVFLIVWLIVGCFLALVLTYLNTRR